jgi:Fe-S-cluster containining protein
MGSGVINNLTHLDSEEKKYLSRPTMKVHDQCIRCGECCLKSSPTLLKTDLPLVKKKRIKHNEIYTLRRGELVTDNINGETVIAGTELIKVAEKNWIKGGCIFYSEPDKSCSIYTHRPSQCVALKCWDTKEFMNVYKNPKLEREDFIEDGVLLGLIEEHEKRCSYSLIEGYIKKIQEHGETALERILNIIKFDYQIRPFVSQKLGLSLNRMNLYFGRPLTVTITMFGLQVIREADGSFLLTVKSR